MYLRKYTAVHNLSHPFFRNSYLAEAGLEWVRPGWGWLAKPSIPDTDPKMEARRKRRNRRAKEELGALNDRSD